MTSTNDVKDEWSGWTNGDGLLCGRGPECPECGALRSVG